MREVVKTFNVFKYEELDDIAQNRAYCKFIEHNNDFMSEIITETAIDDASNILCCDVEDIVIEWNTCSGGFIKDLVIFKRDKEVDFMTNNALYSKVTRTLQEGLDYYTSDVYVREELRDCEFTKSGNYYRD